MREAVALTGSLDIRYLGKPTRFRVDVTDSNHSGAWQWPPIKGGTA
jgi:hypothetical protein